MKLSAYFSCEVQIPLLVTLLFVSCTIIDNDLRDLPDEPGFKEIVYDEGDNFKIEYQFNEDVHYLNSAFQEYVSNVDYVNNRFYLHSYIPESLLPKENDLIFSPGTEVFEYGIQNRVTNIRKCGDYYEINYTHAALKEIYKHFEFESNFNYNLNEKTDSNKQNQHLTRAGTVEVDKKFDESGEWHYFNLLPLLGGDVKVVTNPDAKEMEEVFSIESQDKFDFLGSHSTSVTLKGTGKKGALEGSATINGFYYARWRPVAEGYTRISTSKDYADICGSYGIEIEFISGIEGSANFTIHLLRLIPGLDKLLFRKIPIYAPVNLYFTIRPDLDVEFVFSGSYRKKVSKKIMFNLGACKGIKGKKDDVYVNFPDTSPKITSFTETSSSRSLSVGFYGVLTTTIGFGNPGDSPYTGIEVKGKVGPKFEVKSAPADSDDAYNNGLSIGGHLEISAKAFLDLTEYLTWNWDFLDTLMDAFKNKGTTKKQTDQEGHVVFAYDFLKTTFRDYPSIDQPSITAYNSSKILEFEFSFAVRDKGIATTKEMIIYPILNIYPSGSDKPILEEIPMTNNGDPIGYVNFFYKEDNLFKKKFSDNNLKPDVWYDAEVEMRLQILPFESLKNIYNNRMYYMPIYKKRYKFTAASPTGYIQNVFLSGQYKTYTYKDSQEKTKYYTFLYKIDTFIKNHKDVKRWGLVVNGKEYPIEETIQGSEPTIALGINKCQIPRKITLNMYVVDKQDNKFYGPPYKQTVDFNEAHDKNKDERNNGEGQFGWWENFLTNNIPLITY